MCPNQNRLIIRGLNVTDVVMADCHESLPATSFKFGLIVDYRTEGIKLLPGVRVQELLGLADGADHSATETGTLVYLDSEGHYSRIPNLPWQSPWNQTVSSWSVMSELSRT